jgi:hypothetical protein
MNQIYNCLDTLSEKTDEELFGIYCGYSKNRTLDERYIAARILESRDFKFQEIRTYRLKWEKDNWDNRSNTSKFHHHILIFLRNISSYLLLLLFLALSGIIVAQLFLGHGKWMLSLSGDLWFFLNVLSFVALFYIFGFIGYFSRSFGKFKRKKKEFELAEDSL